MEGLEIPNHIGIIMDGNGRWAQKRNLPRSEGHRAGAENFKKIIRPIFKSGVNVLSIFAFSTENFKRSKEEVDCLMGLFMKFITLNGRDFVKEKIKVVFSGTRENLSKKLSTAMEKLEKKTIGGTTGTLNICLNYGGRLELVDMVKRISTELVSGNIEYSDINENLVSKYMYNDLPDIDFVIRTSGENRISNFMLWQSSYAEYYFPTVFFPDFNEEEYKKSIIEYNNRKRRFGGV